MLACCHPEIFGFGWVLSGENAQCHPGDGGISVLPGKINPES